MPPDHHTVSESRLIITADDYGYWPSYDEGILAAAGIGMLDAVGVMTHEADRVHPKPLIETGVEIGLHIVFEGRWGARSGASARTTLRVQLERFGDLFGRWPSYLDGHKHCHARPELATPVFETATQLEIPVRSIGPDHRQLLRERGIGTADHLIGRMDETEPVEPPELRSLPSGVTEWVVHPGVPDPASGSSYDEGRAEDLDLLKFLAVRGRFDRPVWGDAVRVTHAEAFARPEDDAEEESGEADTSGEPGGEEADSASTA